MDHHPRRHRGRRRLAVIVASLAAVTTLATAGGVPPAGAVPVDGLYDGTIFSGATSAAVNIRLITNGPARGPVTAEVTIGTGATVSCFGDRDIASTFTLSGSGGIASAAPRGTANLTMSGTFEVSGFDIDIDVTGTVNENRTRFQGGAVVDLPLTCGNANLSFDTFSDRPYAIRTGHDNHPEVGGVDITHMIDREPAGTPEPWTRCMFLFATPPGAAPRSAVWSIEPGAPAGAHIRPGWENGAPATDPEDPSNPMRTQVCITDATPADTTFTVAVSPEGKDVGGRLLLWVGEFRDYTARAQGDVHNTTFDELHYDFQGVGEYVDAVAGDGKDFAVQSRLETVPGAPVTVTTAIAARVDGDRVAAYLDASGKVEWYVDGSPVSVPVSLPSGGEITNPTKDHWRVEWPHTTYDPGATTGTSMQVSFYPWAPKDHLNIDGLTLGPGLSGGGQVRGLLGVADRDPANDLTPSWGGSPVSPDLDPSLPPFVQPLYAEFGRSWLVDTSAGPLETLFDYLDPAHPDPWSYQNREYPESTPKVVQPKARAICEKAGVTAFPQIEFCTYDVGVTGDRDIAGYYKDGWHPV